MKLVGSSLDLRKVSWNKQVDFISSRLSTDSSSDEAPRLGLTHTPLPGEDRAIGAADRREASMSSKTTSASLLPRLIENLLNHAEPPPAVSSYSVFLPACQSRTTGINFPIRG